MRHALKTLAIAGLAALGLAGGAQAGDFTITVGGQAAPWRSVADVEIHRHGRDASARFVEERRHGPGRGYDDDGDDGWRERRWAPVAEGRPGWHRGGWDRGGCRVIVKRRVDPWGDVRVRRIKICD